MRPLDQSAAAAPSPHRGFIPRQRPVKTSSPKAAPAALRPVPSAAGPRWRRHMVTFASCARAKPALHTKRTSHEHRWLPRADLLHVRRQHTPRAAWGSRHSPTLAPHPLADSTHHVDPPCHVGLISLCQPQAHRSHPTHLRSATYSVLHTTLQWPRPHPPTFGSAAQLHGGTLALACDAGLCCSQCPWCCWHCAVLRATSDLSDVGADVSARNGSVLGLRPTLVDAAPRSWGAAIWGGGGSMRTPPLEGGAGGGDGGMASAPGASAIPDIWEDHPHNLPPRCPSQAHS